MCVCVCIVNINLLSGAERLHFFLIRDPTSLQSDQIHPCQNINIYRISLFLSELFIFVEIFSQNGSCPHNACRKIILFHNVSPPTLSRTVQALKYACAHLHENIPHKNAGLYAQFKMDNSIEMHIRKTINTQYVDIFLLSWLYIYMPKHKGI